MDPLDLSEASRAPGATPAGASAGAATNVLPMRARRGEGHDATPVTVPLSGEEVPLFAPEAIGGAVVMVRSSDQLAIRIGISTGTGVAWFTHPNQLLDPATTEEAIYRRWGPGHYVLQLIAKNVTSGQMASDGYRKQRKMVIDPADADDVGHEVWPLAMSDRSIPELLMLTIERRKRVIAEGRSSTEPPEGADEEDLAPAPPEGYPSAYPPGAAPPGAPRSGGATGYGLQQYPAPPGQSWAQVHGQWLLIPTPGAVVAPKASTFDRMLEKLAEDPEKALGAAAAMIAGVQKLSDLLRPPQPVPPPQASLDDIVARVVERLRPTEAPRRSDAEIRAEWMREQTLRDAQLKAEFEATRMRDELHRIRREMAAAPKDTPAHKSLLDQLREVKEQAGALGLLKPGGEAAAATKETLSDSIANIMDSQAAVRFMDIVGPGVLRWMESTPTAPPAVAPPAAAPPALDPAGEYPDPAPAGDFDPLGDPL